MPDPDRKTPKEIKTGVIGYPLGHSLSPLIHNHWIRQYGFHGVYQAVEIVPDRLKDSIKHLIAEGFSGFNVTLPFKQQIIELCDAVDDTARRIGAVNTVVVDPDGKMRGTNTDSFGFVENILQSGEGADLKGKAALVLGAGGAARAVVHGLQTMGAADIIIANRTKEKAALIAADFGAQAIAWDEREGQAENIDFIVNTTSLGMSGQPPLEFNIECLPERAIVCDIVYKPLYTPLLQEAQNRGLRIITGIGMLWHQARPAFKQWYGVMPEISGELRKKIREGLQ